MRRVRAWLLLLLAVTSAHASGPRWVTGPPYFTAPAGNPVLWFTTNLVYFTDPGDLSASVSHAAADALVAAAGSTWNIPTAALTLAQGGTLAEHVSSANAYLSSSGPVFPADVQAANYAAIQIAVVYDSDGSVTDLLLGSGASAPAECRQNAVTEDVDSITPAGQIQHAILVLNGRCTGPAPQQQLQMQYQLERAFGRVLGLGWSQTNDNVFTGTPQATVQQAMHWPILHPIDIVCGPYTYQCLPQPFTLRDDDISALTTLYPMLVTDGEVPPTPPAPGKVWSYQQASRALGTVSFPTGEGMASVNVVVQRSQGGWIPEAWYDVSSVTGYLYQQDGGNPVGGAASGLAESMGSTDPALEGFYNLGWIPDIDPAGVQNGQMVGVITTEPINPLYTGAHAVGPYVDGGVSPSGAPESAVTEYVLQPYLYDWIGVITNFEPPDAASNCDTSGDGTESAPLAVPSTGWWTGVLCAHGHTAWSIFAAQAGRTATIEVTALDESGLATTAKAMPLVGVWAATDPTGTLPTVAATPSAFNTSSLGMTATSLATARRLSQSQGLRFVVADARGDGRPDFAYQARVLYADSIQPAAVSLNGGQIAIAGMGFRAGNAVTINGVSAVVSSWTANTIVAIAPPVSIAPSAPVNVAVTDLSTGGSTVMTSVLTYTSTIAPDTMTLVSAPSGTLAVGAAAATPFAVRVLLGDGVTPVVGLPVAFSVSAGSAQFGGCAISPCMVLTDAIGLASITVTPTAFGAVTVQASAVGSTQMASFTAMARGVTALQPTEYVAAGTTVAWTPEVGVIQNGAPASGMEVDWTGSAGFALTPGPSAANANGIAQASATLGPLAAGAQANAQACAWTAICGSFAAVGVDPSAWRIAIVSGAGQTVASPAAFAPVVLLVTDTAGDPVAGAPVAIYQTVDAAEMPCPARGPYPIAPVLAQTQTAAVSDANGLVSVTPMQIAGVAEATNLAVATGTQGFVSLALQQTQ